MTTGKFSAIGVGPGDPELLTLKALNVLRQAEAIYHAGPADREGLAYETVQSFLSPAQAVHSIDLLMVRGHDDWRERYAPAVEQIAADCRAGRHVAFVTEGDPTLYSTASYLWQLLEERHPEIPVEVVPGVTSLTAAAAKARLPLAQKDECLAVLPATYQAQKIAGVLEEFSSVAFLKLGETWQNIIDLVTPDRQVVYAEQVTTTNEFLTKDLEQMRARRPPYFSLLLAKKRNADYADECREDSCLRQSAESAFKQIWVIGLGPGEPRHMTLAAGEALRAADAIVGYTAYLDLLQPLQLRAELFGSPIGKEAERAEQTLELARAGRKVALVSSGDAGVYGMASVLMEKAGADVTVEVIPGVTAATAAAALLGAPLGHDFACISLSDLLTPWEVIERRLEAAGESDLVTVLYNPISQRRDWQLLRARDVLLKHRRPETPVGLVDQAYRAGQRIWHTTLQKLDAQGVSMTATVIIGSTQTRLIGGRMVTPRSQDAGVKNCSFLTPDP